MSTKQIAINGMGRIGRLLFRKIMSAKHPVASIVAVNCSYPAETIAHLLKYDTAHGKWNADIECDQGDLIVDGKRVKMVQQRDPALLPWKQLGIELAVDSTGKFNEREGAAKHLAAGASKVVITAPAKNADVTIVMGVNEDRYDPALHHIVSSASCTTNCLSPILKTLDRSFGVESGWVTTIHAFTNDQRHLDNPHKDLRRARACTQSIIPTTTGVGKALENVLPHLAASIQGIALRVPTQDVSVIDLTVKVRKKTTRKEVQEVFQRSAAGALSRYMEYSELPLVSADFIGNEKSAIVDSETILVAGDQVKLLAWYDNEWGYVSRVYDLIQYMTYKEREEVKEAWNEVLV